MIPAALKESQVKPLTTYNFITVTPWLTENASVVGTNTEITCI